MIFFLPIDSLNSKRGIIPRYCDIYTQILINGLIRPNDNIFLFYIAYKGSESKDNIYELLDRVLISEQ